MVGRSCLHCYLHPSRVPSKLFLPFILYVLNSSKRVEFPPDPFLRLGSASHNSLNSKGIPFFSACLARSLRLDSTPILSRGKCHAKMAIAHQECPGNLSCWNPVVGCARLCAVSAKQSTSPGQRHHSSGTREFRPVPR